MAGKTYDLSQPMDKLIDIAVNKFGEVRFEKVAVGDMTFQVLQINNMQQYIDKLMDKTRSGKKVVLPLWAKIWPSALVMGYSLSQFPLAEGSTVMEIGGGTATGGLVLASRGCRVTVADPDQDALLFSRINALKNGLADSMETLCTDFASPTPARFDCIVGSEFLFDQAVFDRMAAFLDGSLVEGDAGEVFLSLELKRVAQGFFHAASERFKIMKSSATFKDQGSGEEKDVNLFRFKRK